MTVFEKIRGGKDQVNISLNYVVFSLSKQTMQIELYWD